ncbi:MAG: beta-galactosidase, partial [Armatimonadetes bacterium]|nr:beta-galactosidase [Armatimonadota bacterium]
DLNELRLRFSIADDMGRLLMSKVEQAAAEVGFSYELAEFLGKYVYATADLITEGGAIVDQLRAAPVPVVQAERRAREYMAQVSFGGGRHYFRDTRRRLVRAAGAEMGFTWGGDVNNSLDVPTSTFGTYWYHRGPTTEEGIEAAIAEYEASGDVSALAYNTKRALYERTGDTKFLTRAPCFHDPDFMNDLTTTVGEAARQKAAYNFDYYFVGDEGSLTSYGDALDICWGEHALPAFREWLKTEYESLEALNREWKTDYADWESVLPYTTAEAQQTGRFAPWADHRTFMEVTFANANRQVREAVAAGDPEGHIAVSGTQATNAYNGCDWYRLDQVIDDFLSYGGGNQWDLHRSFAKPGAMIGFWTGYGSSGIGVQNAIWTAAIHNVLYPNIFWMYSYLDPDFTYSDSARDMGEAFKALKYEGIGKLIMESERLHDGIAIHFSMPSVHAATITGNHSRPRRGEEAGGRNFPGNRDGWVRVVKDLGMQFEFASSEQVEQGILSTGEYRVLILPMSMALSREEVEAIRSFIAAGGVVIADAGAGAMDEHCSWSER